MLAALPGDLFPGIGVCHDFLRQAAAVCRQLWEEACVAGDYSDEMDAPLACRQAHGEWEEDR